MSLLIGKTEHKYITAISTPYDGYAVVIPHPTIIGNHVRKHFFGVNQSQQAYLESAISWRDQMYATLYGCALPKRAFHRQQTNSSTEMPGVTHIVKIVKKKLGNGTIKEYFVPCIMAQVFTIPGKDYVKPRGGKSKLYSIKKYGEEEAVRLAIEWRNNMIKTLVSVPI
jgi:hypothetical protein